MRHVKVIIAACLVCLGYGLFLICSPLDVFKNQAWTTDETVPSMDFMVTSTYVPRMNYTETKIESLLIDTEGCKILDVDPFDPRLKVFYKKLKSPDNEMQNDYTNLIYLDGDRVVLNTTAKQQILQEMEIEDPKMLTCCIIYFKIFPVEKTDDEVRYLGKCQFFRYSIAIKDEYMKINCFIGDKIFYEKFEVKVIRKSNVEARCRNVLSNAKAKGTTCHDQLSVMIIGIDSVSRLNFHRQLPKTRKVLVERLDAIELLGYNKAGEYTFVCLMPLLSGMLAKDLEKHCEGGEKHPFDKCNFLWDVFGAAGYRTAFVEDMNEFGLFAYQLMGFRRQPADYYGRTFFNAYKPDKENEVPKAWRNVSDDEGVLQWAVEFHREFLDDLHFGHFWISDLSHDDSNTVQWIDPFLSQMLRTLKEEDVLNNTLLIVMSDHGMRFGDIRATDIGRFEAKLPFAFFILPEWFRRLYPAGMENFERNARNRLTTAFDIHRTLDDLANCKVHDVTMSEPSLRKGANLFSNISPRRTCKNAGLGDSVCSCLHHEFEVDPTTKLAQTLISLVYHRVRDIAAQRTDLCAALHLKNTTRLRAETKVEQSHMMSQNSGVVYTVALFTVPGEGHFEGTVVYDDVTHKFLLEPHIRRINKYGNASHCVKNDKELKPICYCLKQ